MSERIKLTKSEAVLYDSWAADYRTLMAQFGALINDNMSMRIAELAREHGLKEGEWDFDHKAKEFIAVAPGVVETVWKDGQEPAKTEPDMLIPGKETVNSEK